MAVGKPNFNLNSYGITYFQKVDSLDEVDESRDDKVNTVTTGGGLKQPTKLDTELGSINTQLNAGQNNKVIDKKPKFKPSKPKVQTNLTPEQEARFDKNSKTHAAEWTKLHPKPMTDKERKTGHTNNTDYYSNKPAKVNHYLGEDEQPNEAATSAITGGVKTGHAPKDVPQGKTQRERWNEAHPKEAEKLRNENRTGDSKGQGRYVNETRRPSSGKGAKEEWEKREGVADHEDDVAGKAHASKVPLNEQTSDSKAVRGVKRDFKNVKNEPNISDEDKKDLIGDNKKVTVGDKGNADKLHENIRGHKNTELPKESDEEKKHRYSKEVRGALDTQAKQRAETMEKERKARAGQKFQDDKLTGEEHKRTLAEDEESDIETTSRAHTGKYRDVQPMEDQPKGADDSKGGYRKDFSNVEAMDIAHKKRTDKETKNLDFQNPKDKKRREAILGHTGDKKENTPSLKPASSRTTIREGNEDTSNVSIQHTEGKVGFDGKKQKPTQTKEQADTNEKVRQVKVVGEMEKEKERKAEATETEELKHDEKGNWKENYTPTAEEKAKRKKERLAAEAKKKEKKTAKKEPKSNLSEAQMKKIMDDKAARDSKTKSVDIIMDMNIMKLNLMKNTPKKGAKQLSQSFIGQTMDAKNSKIATEKPLTEYDNYDNKHGLTARTERHRGNKLRHKNPNVPPSLDHQLLQPPAGSSLMDRDDAEVPKGKKSPKDLGKSSAEIIFKAISLKLDLM